MTQVPDKLEELEVLGSIRDGRPRPANRRQRETKIVPHARPHGLNVVTSQRPAKASRHRSYQEPQGARIRAGCAMW